jgi:phage terminase large subunit GpA-like protein
MILNLSNETTWKVPESFLDDTNQYIVDNLAILPSELPTLKISEHAQKYRVMPPGTPRPGQLELSYTPYLIEPMDTMGPDSIIQRTVILKGAQQGYTMLAECVLCYYMGYSPADILFLSATADSLERWSSRRLETAIDNYDYRKHIYAQETNTKTRKSGDKTYSKQYFGCRLDMASYNSPAGMASVDKRIMLRDETDRGPVELSTGEGSPMAVSAARVNAWGDRSKILDFSTPTTYEKSFIYKEYLKGDQRKYFMPCPNCKTMIQFEMEFEPEKKKYGFKPIMDDGEVIDCVYVCECEYEIKEYEKQEMLQKGEWRPTAKSSDRFLRSYYSPAVLAPASMLSWTKIYKKYLEALNDPDIGMRTFVNIYSGMPYQEVLSKVKIEDVNHLRGIYEKGTIPEGVLFLVASADVQRGKDKYREMNEDDLEHEIAIAEKKGKREKFPRIEMEILGMGQGYRTWQVDYKIFNGSIDNIDGGAWKKMSDFFIDLAKKSDLVRGGYKIPAIKRKDGMFFDFKTILVDSGDGEYTDIVCSYTDKYNNFFPSMGVRTLKDIQEKGDRESASDKSRYRLRKTGTTTSMYLISTLYYKRTI